jgi:hypothetical protein
LALSYDRRFPKKGIAMRQILYVLFMFCTCSALADDATFFTFHCDFDADNWYEQWGLSKAPARTSLVREDPQRKFVPLAGRALRVHVEEAGHYGLSMSFPFKKLVGREPEEIYFRYSLRLADDWTPRRGGKLPGISGTYGRAGWGGRPVDGTDGWSARGSFGGHDSGRTPIGFYCYHMDMRGRYGSTWTWDENELGLLENNRWYSIGQYVRLNTPGEADGILRGWVDGGLAFEKTDVRFRSVDTLKIEAVWINVYLGGTWAAEQDHHLYLDEIVISTEPIPPTSSTR